jgi:hypothetical protein
LAGMWEDFAGAATVKRPIARIVSSI